MTMSSRTLIHASLVWAVSALAMAALGAGTAMAGDSAVSAAPPNLEPAGDSLRLDSRPEWVLKRDEEGIRSYEKKQAGSPLLSYKAEGVIDAPIDLVLSVLLDAERAGEWISHLSESTVVRWIDEPRAYVQLSRFDVPWPVKDRMFVSRVALEIDPETYATVVTYLPTDDAVEVRDAILGSAVGSRFILRPIDGGARTDFTGIGVADPKGVIPAWIVNWAGGSWPHQTIEALRRQVLKSDVAVTPPIARLYEGFAVEPRLGLISADEPAVRQAP